MMAVPTPRPCGTGYAASVGLSGVGIVGSGDLFVVERVSTYPPKGDVFFVADIVEFRDGRIA